VFRLAFHSSRVHLALEHYAEMERKTTRHKWQKVGEGWKPRHHVYNIHDQGDRRPAADTPLPDDVIAQAKAELLDNLVVIGPTDPMETSKW
jgi:hypothetical protein